MEPTHKPRYIVAQTGARRGYAVPAILEKAGMLERFYTDICGNVGWGRWLAVGAWLPFIGPSLKKLANRRVPDSIAAKTRTFAAPNLLWHIHRLLNWSEDVHDRFRQDILRNVSIGRSAAHEGFHNVTHLYVMLTELTPLMQAAFAHGRKVVSEIYILLSSDRICRDEQKQFPGWEPAPLNTMKVLEEFHFTRIHEEWAHHFVCPSAAVADDMVENWGARRDQVHIVPYGMSPTWLDLKPHPSKGRVLFVGSAILRKGIHYLAMAAEELVRRGRTYEFRVAGHVEDQIRNHPQCRHLTFLGRVPRDQVPKEFQQADIFTLPSLAEGSAEVTYEALAAGLPLVTTRASGSVATDGVEGRIVPERDPIALADALESIIEDRALRDRMAAAARTTARDYTWERYGERLISVLQNL